MTWATLLARLPFSGWTIREWSVCLLAGLLIASLPIALIEGHWLRPHAVLLWSTVFGTAAGVVTALAFNRGRAAAVIMVLLSLSFSIQYHSQIIHHPLQAYVEVQTYQNWLHQQAIAPTASILGCDRPAQPQPDLPTWRAFEDRLSIYIYNLQTDVTFRSGSGNWRVGQIAMGTALSGLVVSMSGMIAWAVIRQRLIWWMFILVQIGIGINLFNSNEGWDMLVLGAAAGVLLLGDQQLRAKDREWQRLMPYGIDLDWWGWNALVAGLTAASMIIAIIVTGPAFKEWVDKTFARDGYAEGQGEGTSGSSSPGPADGGAAGVWPTENLLSGGPELAEVLVMTVYIPDVAGGNFYFRATSYDRYTGGGWRQTLRPTSSASVSPVWPATLEPPPYYTLLREQYRMVHPTQQVFSAGRVIRISQAVEGAWLAAGDPDPLILTGVIAQSAYDVVSWVPVASPDDLRNPPDPAYEDWVIAGYLDLPDSLPERVREMAEAVTAGSSTTYDRALALQTALRAFEYSLDIEAPPAGQDAVDYFLFDLQMGYCDYYASAFVVMARSVGIPARLSSGYTSGTYSPESSAYQVMAINAHAWPEVYFPDYGWIRFEPTGSLPAVSHGAEWVDWPDYDEGEDDDLAPEAGTIPSERRGANWLWLAGLVPAAMGVGAAGVAARSYLRRVILKRLPPGQILKVLYHDLVNAGGRFHLVPQPDQTAEEFCAMLASELQGIRDAPPRWGGDWSARFKQATGAIQALIGAYNMDRFSPRQIGREQAEELLIRWPRLSRSLWLFWLAYRLNGKELHKKPHTG
nr:transglutaminase domain-containing protein [Anaerolineae bacterium]